MLRRLPPEYLPDPVPEPAPYLDHLDRYDAPPQTEQPFTGDDPLDVPNWSEPVPESLERPWGSEPDWGANPEAKVPDGVQDIPLGARL